MTQIIAEFSEISGQYDAVFCDLWGCVHDGVKVFPAAVAALQAYRARGGIVVLVTNSPRPKPSVAAQLERLGMPRDAWDEIATSGDAAQFGLVSGAVGKKVYHIGAVKDGSFFTEVAADLPQVAVDRVPLAEAEGIVCTGLVDDRTETPEDYRGVLMLAREAGLTMLCANPDIVVDMGHERRYCAGALAQLYEEIGGTALYFGKPHPPIYDLARRRLAGLVSDLPDSRILCIGDGIATDIQGASGEGLDALFITGGLAAKEFGPDPLHPAPEALEHWLAARSLSPRWSISLLR